MIKAQPAPEIFQIVSDLTQIADDANFEEFPLQQSEVRIRRLLTTTDVEPAMCYVGLGLVGMLRGDVELTLSAANNAIALSPRNPVVVSMAITTLGNIGNLRDALVIISKFADKFLDDKDFLYCAVIHAMQSLNFSMANDLLSRFELLAVNDIHDKLKITRVSLVRTLNALMAQKFTEDELLERGETAIDTLRRRGFIVRTTSILTLHDGSFLYQLYVEGDRAQCASMNFSIAESLIEKFDNTASELMSIICRPIGDIEHGRKLIEAIS